MENIENIITENAEDVITMIPEEVIPVKSGNGMKAAGWFGLGVLVGSAAYKGGKWIAAKVKAKKDEKEHAEDQNVVDHDDFVEEDAK